MTQTILIIDDEASNIKVLGNLLKDKFSILATTHATKVFDILDKSALPDLILLDVVMPEINGYDLCKLIKDKEAYKNIPIIFITSKDSEEDEIKGFSVGAVDFIKKPFHTDIVLARVHAQLELKKYHDLLTESAYIDGLTGIYNRRKFDEFYKEVFSIAERNKSSLAIIMLDIDQFKKYNDHYGHLQGDEALKTVAQAIAEVVKRRGDLVARYGGEEFVCVLVGSQAENVERLSESIRQNVVGKMIAHQKSDVSDYVTVSVGVAISENVCAENFDQLKLEADQALYEAKESGRNRYILKHI